MGKRKISTEARKNCEDYTKEIQKLKGRRQERKAKNR